MSRWLLGCMLWLPQVAWAGENLAAALEQSGSATTAEKQAFAAKAVEEISDAVAAVEKLKAEAEKDKNTEAIECLQRKLKPLAELSEAAGTAASALSSAVATSDVVSVDLQYRRVAVALTKAREFLAEAQACVGETGARKGSSRTSLDGNEDEGPSLAEIPEMVPDPSPG